MSTRRPLNGLNLRLRSISSKLHLYVGLALGLLAFIVSLTGSALVFRVEIDRLLNPEMLTVTPDQNAAPLEKVVTAAADAVPDDRPRLVRFPRSSEAPYEVWLTDNTHVYVDPGTATVLGVRGYEEGLMNTLFALHTKLFAGKTGEYVVGVTGLLLLLLAATGVVLWWPALTLRWRRLRAGLVVVWRRGLWRLNYDLHRTGGFYTALFLVLISATGCALVFSPQTGALLNAITGSSPPPPPPTVDMRRSAPGDFTMLDEALQTARRELPDAEVTFMALPQADGDPLAVRMRTPPELHPNGRSYVYFVPGTDEVLRTDDARLAPLGAQLLHLAYPLHIGAVGSVAVRVLYVLLGLAPALLSVTGTFIWYRRWRKQNRRIRPSSADANRPTPITPAELPSS